MTLTPLSFLVLPSTLYLIPYTPIHNQRTNFHMPLASYHSLLHLHLLVSPERILRRGCFHFGSCDLVFSIRGYPVLISH